MAKYHSYRQRSVSYWLVPLVLVSVIVWTRQITADGLALPGGPRHAMDGVFLADLITHWPTGTIRDWAYQYYAKFPCLGLIVYWPPFFAMVEAVVFLVFGVSAWAGRATVIIFAIGGLLGMYWVVRQLLDRDSAMVATAIWAGMYPTVFWARQVALAVPAATMVLLCCGCYIKFRDTRRKPWLWAAGAVFVLAVLTHSWAVFIGLAIVFDLVLTGKLRRAAGIQAGLVAAVTGGIILGYFLFRGRIAVTNVFLPGPEYGWSYLWQKQTWWFYIGSLPETLGWLVLAFSVIGLMLLGASGRIRQVRPILLWVAAFYVFASVVPYKSTQYAYMLAPAAAILAGGGLQLAVSDTQLRRACEAIIVILICWQFLVGWHADAVRGVDYRAAAKYIAHNGGFQLVLVDIDREGQFIFDMREVQGYPGGTYVLRGSKLLHRRPSGADSASAIRSLIDDHAIRYVVVEADRAQVEDRSMNTPGPSRLLRQVLQDTRQFEKVDLSADFAEGSQPAGRLELYRNLRAGRRRVDRVTIPIPAMGQSLEIALPVR